MVLGPVKRYVLNNIMKAVNVNNTMKVISTIKEAEFILENLHSAPRFKNRYQLFNHGLDQCTVDGLVMEFGVFQGESLNHIAKRIPDLMIYGFDSFEGLPETWNTNNPKGHFKIPTLPNVESNVELVVGYFEDTFTDFLETHQDPARFVHLDADLYSSTQFVLESLANSGRLVNGTVIQFDEFIRYPESFLNGEAKAFYEAVEAHGLSYDYVGYSTSGAGRLTVKVTGSSP